MKIKTKEQIAREDNIIGWILILTIVLFIGATCKASQNVKIQSATNEETQ